MAKSLNRLHVAKNVAMVMVCAAVLSACNRTSASLSRNPALNPSTSKTAPIAAANEVYAETEIPESAVQDPNEGVVNLPSVPKASTTAVEPNAMDVRALATTLTNAIPGLGSVKTTIIRAQVTWTPVKGAGAYRVYRQAVAEGNRNGKKDICYYLPQWVPVALVGGGLGGMVNLNVGQEYIFSVEALDRSGNVIASGEDNCAPLNPLELPYLREPSANGMNVGQTPYLKWTPSRGADGYYVEVFKTLRGVLPTVPMWRGFRGETDANVMLYGQTMDTFEGTRPLQWSLPMSIGTKYAWTVCAIRTDTHNMQNAKAIAKATAALSYFTP